MSLFQITVLPILFWFGYKQYIKFRGASALKILYQARWLFITLLAVLFVGDPVLTSIVAKKLGIGRGTDVVVYFALIWLLYQNYTQSQEIENLYNKLDKLVRQSALKNTYADKTKKQTDNNAKKSNKQL
ncbi:DUF2304 domain-containing protein [Patescibacteria group bacterium]|nr:DUF2304 domain-containing protein [Patescibacteria group bacterium]